MLGIVNPGLVSVDALSKSTRKISDCNLCGHAHEKGDCPAYGKECHKCGGKNHFRNKCRSKKGSKSKSESRCDSRRPSRANGKCLHKCRVYEVNEECHDDMDDLTEQVHSLFYQ